MKNIERNPLMTVGRLKEALKNIPNDVLVNVKNSEGKSTANIEVWFEDLDTRKFVELIGYKPFYEMDEKDKTLINQLEKEYKQQQEDTYNDYITDARNSI